MHIKALLKPEKELELPLISCEHPLLPWLHAGSDLFEWKNSVYVLVVNYFSQYIKIPKLSRIMSEEVIQESKSIFA